MMMTLGFVAGLALIMAAIFSAVALVGAAWRFTTDRDEWWALPAYMAVFLPCVILVVASLPAGAQVFLWIAQ
jgi:hypothetical protein